MDSHHVLSTLFFFYVEEIRTDTRLFLGEGGGVVVPVTN